VLINVWKSHERVDDEMSNPRTKASRSAAKDIRTGVALQRERAQRKVKKTGKWCRGKSGIEHEWILGEIKSVINGDGGILMLWRVDRCGRCTKKRFVDLKDSES